MEICYWVDLRRCGTCRVRCLGSSWGGGERMGVLRPPVALALARDQREVPGPDSCWAYEPKFDGWRAAVFTASGMVQSRRDRDLAVRFPEVAAAARSAGDLILDGELVALRDGRLDF